MELTKHFKQRSKERNLSIGKIERITPSDRKNLNKKIRNEEYTAICTGKGFRLVCTAKGDRPLKAITITK